MSTFKAEDVAAGFIRALQPAYTFLVRKIEGIGRSYSSRMYLVKGGQLGDYLKLSGSVLHYSTTREFIGITNGQKNPLQGPFKGNIEDLIPSEGGLFIYVSDGQPSSETPVFAISRRPSDELEKQFQQRQQDLDGQGWCNLA